MGNLYNLSIQLYSILMKGISLFHPKAKLWVNGRQNILDRITKAKLGNTPVILIHCSSLGEFEQGRPLLEEIKKKYPDYKIVLSFFSPSGFEIQKNNPLADLVLYLPIDTLKKVQAFTQALNIKKAYFIKYEFWPNLFAALKNSGSSIYMISAIFRPDQYFFKPNAKWYRNNTLGKVDHFFVQNQQSADILQEHHFTNYSITGDTRFDRVSELNQTSFTDSKIEAFTQSSKKVLVAGSTWLEDEKLIFKFLENSESSWKLILAPHEIHEQHLKQIESLSTGLKIIRYSTTMDTQLIKDADVLLIDNIGKLKYLYRFGTLCYIGGGFGVGIHNTLEAATYGKPVLFGPKFQKFEEAKQLIEIGAGISISTEEELIASIADFINEENYTTASKAASHFIHQHKGATDIIVQNTLQ